MPTDQHWRELFIQWRRARIREANELGELAGVDGAVRSLTDDEWREVQRMRRERVAAD